MSKISIIIPIYNEVESIDKLLLHIEKNASQLIPFEIIMVDGGSTDESQNKVVAHPNIILITTEKGRAKQLNAGAKIATAEVLYFLHCDSLPPKDFDLFIMDEVEKGNKSGCFRMKFDYQHPVLVLSQWFTRINHISCRGGDQSLFVTKILFNEIKGFNEDYIIYEDNELISRLYNKKEFVVIPENLITSARKYRENGIWRLQYHFAVIHLKRRLGHSAESMLNYYNKRIK
jgi:rSAM/selenodomain-associated transferase 2